MTPKPSRKKERERERALVARVRQGRNLEEESKLCSVPLTSARVGSRRPCPSLARHSGAVERTPASRRLVPFFGTTCVS